MSIRTATYGLILETTYKGVYKPLVRYIAVEDRRFNFKNMENKCYWFSTKKYANDINFRYDRASNEIAKLEMDGKPVPEWLEKLATDLDEIRDYMIAAYDEAVLLPANLYRVAMDTVCWAASVR